METSITEYFIGLGTKMHFNEQLSWYIANIISLIIIFAVAIGLYYLAKLIVNLIIHRVIRRSKSKTDDLLIKNRVFVRICLLVPAYVIRVCTPVILTWVAMSGFIVGVTRIFEVIVFALVINSAFDTANDFYNTLEMSKMRPIKSLIQVIKIIVFIICALFVITILSGKSMSSIFIGLGTASAVLMLIFKDSILGFVGGIQLSVNDMIRIGDWIEMSKNGADGNVIEIGLTTVKVQNWDNTITTIPTYSLVSDSFTNWRGMSESKGRRIKRSVNIDVDSVKFCTPEMLERFKKFELVRQYIEDTENSVKQYNTENKIDTSVLVNGQRQTNIGIFRAYLTAYLKSNPNISKEMTLMVRQLQPGENGIPIEIYVFSNNKDWTAYENIQSDIFDHIYACVPMFDLKIFQKPSSTTISSIAAKHE